MDVRDLVTAHYGVGDLTGTMLARLSAAGIDVDPLTAESLYPVDQLHAGGAGTTRDVLAALEVHEGDRVLDVGCGIGGASRMAATYGAEVTGVDLTPDFVRAATELTRLTGLADRARFVAAPAEQLPLEDASFDKAFLIHVGMNVPDKQQVFAEVHRVLRPGGRFVLQEQMRLGPGDLTWPMPWADDERTSFLETPDDYRRGLEAVGFSVGSLADVTSDTAAHETGAVSPVAVFGDVFAERVANYVQAARAGIVGAVRVAATR